MFWLAARHRKGHLLIGRSACLIIVLLLLLRLLGLGVEKKKKNCCSMLLHCRRRCSNTSREETWRRHVAGDMLFWTAAQKQVFSKWMLNMLQTFLQKELCYNVKLSSGACLLGSHKLKGRNSTYDQAALDSDVFTQTLRLNKAMDHKMQNETIVLKLRQYSTVQL